MIYHVDISFNQIQFNPFNNNEKYTKDWIMLKLIDDRSFRQYTGGGVDGIFQLVITKKNIDWEYRVMDFLQYGAYWNKNIILAINDKDYDDAKSMYGNHSYTDNFLRPYEKPVLMHSTTKENYHKIMKSSCLKSWALLKQERLISEVQPIGALLGDPYDYRYYIMFNNGGDSAERVISSKQKGYIETDVDVPYTAGARYYFDAKKIAEDGLLVRDGAHQKIMNMVPLNKYLIWIVTVKELELPEVTTPRTFSEQADKIFQDRFKMLL